MFPLHANLFAEAARDLHRFPRNPGRVIRGEKHSHGPDILRLAEEKYKAANAIWVEGDAMSLPFPDASFDLVTSAFGFRNLRTYSAGLAEIYRVLRPGGVIGILECNQPDGVSGALYNLYFQRALPVVGGWLSGDRRAYEYLPASVQRFPRPARMLRLMEEAGFTRGTWEGYLLRAAGLFRGIKG